MATKTLNNVSSIAAPSATFPPATYSIEPRVASVPTSMSLATSADLELFLDGDNPIGCFRGVMWVMAFNAAAFLVGFMVWQSVKHLL